MTDLEKDIQACKEQQGTSNIPVLSYEMIMNPELRKQFLGNKGAFHVLKRDKDKIMNI